MALDTLRASASTGEQPGSSLTIQAFSKLREMIISGELPPGQRLKVELLRDVLGIGATPIREALSLLTSEDLVERLDKRGFRVSDVSIEHYDDLHRSRSFLEAHVLAELIGHGDQAWEDRVVLSGHRLRRAPRLIPDGNRSNPDWERAHKQFHMSLLSACPSSTLQQFCASLHDQLNRYRSVAAVAVSENRDWKTEHEEIAEACIDRDVDEAVRRLMDHYNRTTAILRATLVHLDNSRSGGR